MNLHTASFWACMLFLLGVLVASAWGAHPHLVWYVSGLTALLSLALLLFERRAWALLCGAIIIGSGYYVYVAKAQSITLPIGKQVAITGLVIKVFQTDSGQQADISLVDNSTELSTGVVRVFADPYPELRYGDRIAITGTLKALPDDRRGYYAKEGVDALMSYPKQFEIIERGQGSAIKGRLFSIRDYVRTTFERLLPAGQGTLLTGLVIGKSSGFSKAFNEKLRLTGTTHLVALSGYNIAMLIEWLLAILGLVLLRRYAVWVCIVAVAAFVIMTGAEASVVRAAIMAGIMILAERTQRTYSVRNAIAVTAVAMVLVNPHVLTFDIGFQLSFAALIGIVYLKPVVDRWFRFDSKKPGLLEWRKNLATTFAAQLAVLPILLTNFGFVAPLSILTNVLLLSFIPMTMVLGVVVLCASLLSETLAFFVALPARLLLGYELGVINLFSKINFGFEVQHFPMLLGVLFYAVLAFVILRTKSTPDLASTT